MSDSRRLIEVAFPLKQASLDSVHEKNVRHGHISTLHIWPARRPLAASRAALIATLLPDPGDPEERRKMLERLGGVVRERRKTKKLPDGTVEETIEEYTEGGILHWGRESGPDLDWFREQIRAAYGGRAPKVLDPFAGGGAIPLEAMRLGCEVTAVDINPVAWFILKCTLEYPQRLAGQKRPLPEFVLQDREFMEAFFKSQGFKGASLEAQLGALPAAEAAPKAKRKKAAAASPAVVAPQLPGMQAIVDVEADLAWHVRAWGKWVLERARADLERFYPTVDGKPTVAYLWARTVTCKNCRATVPLLKTGWLCQKPKKRIALTMTPNAKKTGVEFGILENPPKSKKGIGEGTMSRSGATCPCCGSIMTMEDIRTEGQAGRLGAVMTAVVVDGEKGKEYRLPTKKEVQMAAQAEKELERVFADIPFGMPEEPTPAGGGSGASRAFSVQGYGLMRWRDLFTSRQLLALGAFVKHTRAMREAMLVEGYPVEWVEATNAYMALATDRLTDSGSSIAHWQVGGEFVVNTFQRFALPISWDFAEVNFASGLTGSYEGAINWIALACDHFMGATRGASLPTVIRNSATQFQNRAEIDIIVTDPPYYDAIPYSDAMDFFYVWLRRTLYGASPEINAVFSEPSSPKWDHETSDGELIDDDSRFSGDREKSKAAYEDGMARAFQVCCRTLTPDGRLVIVFAHKQPDAWETLVSAIIRAGFVVDGSWPIQTERETRTRSLSSAALSSSVWMVCKKRPASARPGWDNRVLAEMREKITTRLRDFWDAGIRGPDFVWAATGPALEAYSQYPVVKKANEPGQVMSVNEFLRHVRRMVVDFVVGRVLSGDGDMEAVSGLDDVTTYYLLHRHDFGMDEAPAGAAILYAVSCNLSDRDLVDRHAILEQTGSTLRLLPWTARKSAGYDPVLDSISPHPNPLPRGEGEELPSPFGRGAGGEGELRELPLIDQAHRLMHLWRAGDVTRVDAYLDARGLRRSALFHQLLQALIELAPAGSEERALLESISNYLGAKGTTTASQMRLAAGRTEN